MREHASAGAGDDLEMLCKFLYYFGICRYGMTNWFLYFVDYLLHFLVYAILMSLSILTNVSVKSTRPFLTIIPLTAIAYILKSFPIEKGILSIILSQGILYILVTLCNKSFTLGESTLISQAISLFLMDFINLFWGGNTLAQRRDPTTVFFYALVLGMLGIGVVNAPVFMKLVEKSYPVVTVKVSKTKNAKSRINNEDDSNNSSKAYIGYSLAFWVVSITVVVGIIRPWVEGILGVDPFVWVFMFLFAENSRMMLCAYWVVCLLMIFVFRKWLTAVSSSSSTSTPSVTKSKKEEATAKTQKMQLNFRRKFYHGLAVVMFGVGWIVDVSIFYYYYFIPLRGPNNVNNLQPPFLHLALSLALSAILLLEYIRIFRIWPLGKDLDIFMKSFIDSKDGYGPLITSHLFLLVGCAATVWLESILNPYNGSRGEGVLDTQSLWTIVSLGRAPFRFLVALSGTIILGVGDSMASVVGYRYGKTLWSAVVSRFVKESSEKTRVSRKSDNSIPLGKKSVEGSLYGMVGCSVLVVMVCVGVLDFNCFLAWGVEKWVTYVGCVVACGKFIPFILSYDAPCN